MLDKISIYSIFFTIFLEFVTLLPIHVFLKTSQTNSCMRHAERKMVITPWVINDPAEIENLVPIIIL